MVDEKIKSAWKAIEELVEEVYDLQPSAKKQVGETLSHYIMKDMRQIAKEFGVKLP